MNIDTLAQLQPEGQKLISVRGMGKKKIRELVEELVIYAQREKHKVCVKRFYLLAETKSKDVSLLSP